MGFRNSIRKKFIKTGSAAVIFFSLVSVGFTSGLAAGDKKLIPLGNAVGITLQSDGVLVVGIPEFLADGTSSPAHEAGMAVGDIITEVESRRVSSNEELKAAVSGLDGKSVSIKVLRGNKSVDVSVVPHKNAEGGCELGLWLRDAIAGIGTLTFYDPDTGDYGALGHSVNDSETGIIIPLKTGSILRSSVTDIVQGKAGYPGQLHGTFNSGNVIGNLMKNSSSGIFGQMSADDLVRGKTAMPAAKSSEIKTGPATILSNISGTEVSEYQIEITRLYTGAESAGRSMMLTVTDPRLLDQTGGIVQGMSGSPIIQDGKLIGAVTHVLINDPTRGYGISIEKMLNTAADSNQKKAA